MKEYHVLASIHNDLLTEAVVKNPRSKDPGHSTNIHIIMCDSLEEIRDLFLDVCGDDCLGMNSCMYWYVDDGSGWVLTDL